MRNRILLVAACGALLTLAGCGDDDSGGGSSGADSGGGGDKAKGKVAVLLPDSKSSVRWETVDRPFLISSTFAEALPAAERVNLVSVGRFALRGVGQAKELFTLDPETL